ncbi:MAG TPA: hypothetical protein VMO47_18150, partial [Rhodothermales bacterium]|nr:hypothetical protein [Rhodothermales bacterium]
SAFFRFANRFAATRQSIPEDYVVTDAVFDEFRSWLDDEGFVFESRAEFLLAELSDEAKGAGYEIGTELTSVERSLESQKDLEFGRHETRLKEELRKEILARYFGETALIRASLAHDAQVKHASRLLAEPGALRDILGRD